MRESKSLVWNRPKSWTISNCTKTTSNSKSKKNSLLNNTSKSSFFSKRKNAKSNNKNNNSRDLKLNWKNKNNLRKEYARSNKSKIINWKRHNKRKRWFNSKKKKKKLNLRHLLYSHLKKKTSWREIDSSCKINKKKSYSPKLENKVYKLRNLSEYKIKRALVKSDVFLPQWIKTIQKAQKKVLNCETDDFNQKSNFIIF